MSKMRIYELARDLNLKNKVLLEKLGEMGIKVASHMSSLDNEIVARIKQVLLGKKEKGAKITRVKSTVLRRRKKVPETVAPSEVEISESTDIPVEKDDAAIEEDNDLNVVAETESASELIADEAESPETSTEIIEEIEPTDFGDDAPDDKIIPDDEIESETIKVASNSDLGSDLVSEEKEAGILPLEEDASGDEKSDYSSNVVPMPVKDDTSDDKTQEGDSPAISEIPSKAKVKIEKTKRRREKDAPAKIIKLGVAQPRVVPPKSDKRAPSRERTQSGPEKKGVVEGSFGADRQKQTEEQRFGKKRFAKKRISFRKKEVVEGPFLYSSRARGRKGKKGGRGKSKASGMKTQITTAKAIKRRIKIDETIPLSDLAKRMGIKASEMIKKLMGMGVMVTLNQIIDFDTALLVAAEFDYEVERASFEEDVVLKVEQDDPEALVSRPPVVTIMGHVDHGKTSLLDVIRSSGITEGEAGGITQHIGAYHVETDKGQIVFLDTPGHEAFTAMRSRGAGITDLVVLVVAADDGVMPQTIEAINHSKAAEVPIIVAVNKIDKANADPERVMRQLSENGLNPEEWGGDTIFIKVSAKSKEGVDDLLEMILLQAELLELKANPSKLARGHVVEAKLDSGRGAVATVLIQEGTLNTGDSVVCGIHYGKVRALIDDSGSVLGSAGPSVPVEIVGLSGVPNAGDELVSLADEKNAKQVSNHRVQKQRAKELAKTSRRSLENLFEQMKEGEVKDLNIILKADVHGSIEALRDSLVKLSNAEVKINTVHAATGTITESDVSLATVSDAIIIGFNVRPNSKVQTLAQEENVDIRYYSIIYNVIQDVQDAIVGMMESTFEERSLGQAEVREVFHVPRVGSIAGCYVVDGTIERGRQVHLLREGVVIYEGKIGSLKRFKDDAKEVQSGYECGIGIENYNDIKVGDTIECYYLEEIRPTIA